MIRAAGMPGADAAGDSGFFFTDALTGADGTSWALGQLEPAVRFADPLAEPGPITLGDLPSVLVPAGPAAAGRPAPPPPAWQLSSRPAALPRQATRQPPGRAVPRPPDGRAAPARPAGRNPLAWPSGRAPSVPTPQRAPLLASPATGRLSGAPVAATGPLAWAPAAELSRRPAPGSSAGATAVAPAYQSVRRTAAPGLRPVGTVDAIRPAGAFTARRPGMAGAVRPAAALSRADTAPAGSMYTPPIGSIYSQQARPARPVRRSGGSRVALFWLVLVAFVIIGINSGLLRQLFEALTQLFNRP